MKKLLVLVVCLVGGLSAFAQGFVSLANLGAGVNSAFKDINGVALAGANWTVELLTGATAGSVADSVTPFFTGNFSSGYFNGGPRTVQVSDVFAWPASPNPAAPNGTWAQVRVWNNGGGTFTSYDAAKNAGQQYGITAVWESPVQTSTTLPAAAMAGMPLINGNGNLTVVPEPSVIALAGLGITALLLRRRK